MRRERKLIEYWTYCKLHLNFSGLLFLLAPCWSHKTGEQIAAFTEAASPLHRLLKRSKTRTTNATGLKTSRRMNCLCRWWSPYDLWHVLALSFRNHTPQNCRHCLLSEVSGVAVELLLSVVHLCSYPNALKQVLFDLKINLVFFQVERMEHKLKSIND